MLPVQPAHLDSGEDRIVGEVATSQLADIEHPVLLSGQRSGELVRARYEFFGRGPVFTYLVGAGAVHGSTVASIGALVAH